MASPDYSDGCMIALYPTAELAQELAVEGGLPPEEMHVTVAYCGDAAGIDGDILREVTTELAERQPITAQLAGLARFTGGDKDVIVALVDSADLEDLRRDTLDALHERGIQLPRDHGYTAHLTITYLDVGDPSPMERLDARPVGFTALSAVHGTDRTDSPLEHPMAAPAREAFAAGWALSGGPMTERVKAASIASVRTAIECADDPRILEVTIDLGRLEGMWAKLFARREEQQQRHARLVADAWRQLVDRSTIATAVDAFRRHAGLAEADKDTDHKQAAALAAVAMISALPDSSGWQELRAKLRDAIAAGRAEGMVNAVAVAAEQAGRSGLDWNAAFDDAYRDVARLDEPGEHVDTWLGRLVDRAETALARVLQRSADEGADADAMADAAQDALTPNDDDLADSDVDFIADWAMTSAGALGALALYQSEGALTCDWVSVGDGRVCYACEANEAGSPWALGDLPEWPAHPRCRCFVSASVDLDHFAAWFT
ncbi:MAG: 2'-5' RNA ligase family protein [Streptomyces sp.]|nr:2'-5' RNA ligase family protein [Streptomyces sp.]